MRMVFTVKEVIPEQVVVSTFEEELKVIYILKGILIRFIFFSSVDKSV